MKKVLLIIAFLFILVAIPLTVFLTKQRQDIRQRATPATSLYFDPSEPTTIDKQVNDTFDVPIKMDTGQNQVAAVRVKFTYDQSKLEYISYTVGGDFHELAHNTDTAGIVDVTVTTDSGSVTGVNGSGISIITVQFKALADTGAAGTSLAFVAGTQASAFDDPNRDVISGKANGLVVIGETAGATPQPSATGGASPAPSASGGASPSPSASGVTLPSPSASGGTGGGNPSPSPSATLSPSATAAASPSPSASSGQTTVITTPSNGATVTSKRPTISGRSFANALMVLSISNTSIAATFNADASGNWSYVPTVDLANGSYTVTVTGDNIGSGVPETATSNFTVNTSGTGGTLVATPAPTPTPRSSASSGGTGGGTTTTSSGTSSAIPVTGTSMPTIFAFSAAALLLIFGTLAVIW